jgi:hypothetical protein
MRLVQTALRCYPERWRSRHGDEAAEVARLLMRDGMPARSIAWSYLRGAASTRLVLAPRRRLGAAAGVLLAAACSVSCALALLSASVPASAASVVRVHITSRGDAAAQLESQLRAHHFGVTIRQEPVSPSLAGSIIRTGGTQGSPGSGNMITSITGRCAGGAWGCTDGIGLPVHFTGAARIVIGRAARPGERYAAAADIFRPGELLHCSTVLGESVQQAVPVLDSLHVTIAWEAGRGTAAHGPVPSGRYYVTGGTARSSAAITIRVSTNPVRAAKPADSTRKGRHGQHC